MLSLCPLSDVFGVNKPSSFSLSAPVTVSRPLVVLTACFWAHATKSWHLNLDTGIASRLMPGIDLLLYFQ